MERGMLLVFTGNSENNGTSAVGQVLRALGAGLKVCVVQFRPESRQGAELASLQRFFPTLHVHGVRLDCPHLSESETQTQPEKLWQTTQAIIDSGECDLLVLLEPSWLTDHNGIREEVLLDAIRARPASLHVIVAGGRALDSLVQEANLVTEVKDVKTS